jgi:integrase
MRSFLELAVQYLSQRSVAVVYEKNVLRVAGRAGLLSVERINEYLRQRLTEVKDSTVRSERTILLGLLRDAYERGIINEPPRGIMRIKAKKPPTRAWTISEMKQLLARCEEYGWKRLRSGVKLSVFMRAWILLGYESGARQGDLFAMRASHLQGNVLRWTQSKTGDPLQKILTPACVEACRRMLELSPDGRILGYACRPRNAMRLMKSHVTACGVDGTSKWLRRSGATHIEIASPGRAKHHLGHRSVGLAERSYIDWGQIRQHIPQTPVLVGGEESDGVA